MISGVHNFDLSPFLCILSLPFVILLIPPCGISSAFEETHIGVQGCTMVMLFTREGLSSCNSPSKPPNFYTTNGNIHVNVVFVATT